MKVAHLIITYTNPQQTERLIRKLQHPDADFYIHLDKKVAMETHANLLQIPNVYFIKNRVDTGWATYSAIETIFSSFREILASGRQYDFINSMSGQDYPIKSTAALHHFLEQSIGKEFLTCRHFDTEWQESLARIQQYHMTNYNFKGKYIIQKVLNAIMPKRKCPLGYQYYGGSMYWTISPAAAQYVLDIMDNNPAYKKFILHTWAPDEFLIPTILMNSPFKDKIVRENLLLVYFPPGMANPKVFTVDDVEVLRQSDRFFARKFKVEVDAAVFDTVDALTSETAVTMV